MNDANHPMWAIIRLAILLVAMCVVLWFNATNFDDTEIKAIVQLFLGAIGIEGGIKLLKGVANKGPE